MTKRDYIIKQLSKTNKKNFENYVLTRIWHLLNREDIKFVTQQYVHRPNGHALTDMYFPQLNLHIEVDESFHKKQVQLDINRETDIIQATNHIIKRIEITEEIEPINKQIDEIIDFIRSIIKNQEMTGKFESWDFEKKFDPDYYVKKGYLDIAENPAFRRIVDACNCLGQNYIAVQSNWFKSKVYDGYYLWFPKFYNNDEWDNSISDDGLIITEKCKNPKKAEKWFNNTINNPVKRITFPRRIDNLGFRLYKFTGIFETDLENSSIENGVIHRRVADRFEMIKAD